ncbi:MAG: dockerin type I domain-containing protein [Propionivibrio sp.]
MTTLKHLLLAFALTTTCVVSSARADVNPLHNPINGLDVDANSLVSARDALLVINVLLQPKSEGLVASALASSTPLYVDTTDDGSVSPRDALLVINHLTTAQVPEPGTFALAVVGGLGLAGYGWNRKRAKA